MFVPRKVKIALYGSDLARLQLQNNFNIPEIT